MFEKEPTDSVQLLLTKSYLGRQKCWVICSSCKLAGFLWKANRKSVHMCVYLCVWCSSWKMIIKYIFLKLWENQRDLFEAGQIAGLLQMTVMADFWEDAGA